MCARHVTQTESNFEKNIIPFQCNGHIESNNACMWSVDIYNPLTCGFSKISSPSWQYNRNSYILPVQRYIQLLNVPWKKNENYFEKKWTWNSKMFSKFPTFFLEFSIKVRYEGLIFFYFGVFATLPGTHEGEKRYPDKRSIPVPLFPKYLLVFDLSLHWTSIVFVVSDFKFTSNSWEFM